MFGRRRRRLDAGALSKAIRDSIPGIAHEGRLEVFAAFLDTLGAYYQENPRFQNESGALALKNGLLLTPARGDFASDLVSRIRDSVPSVGRAERAAFFNAVFDALGDPAGLAELVRTSVPRVAHDGRLALFQAFLDTLGAYYRENPRFEIEADDLAREGGLLLAPTRGQPGAALADLMRRNLRVVDHPGRLDLFQGFLDTLGAYYLENPGFRHEAGALARDRHMLLAPLHNEVLGDSIELIRQALATIDRESRHAVLGAFVTDADDLTAIVRQRAPTADHQERIELFQAFLDIFGAYYIENAAFQAAAGPLARDAGLLLVPARGKLLAPLRGAVLASLIRRSVPEIDFTGRIEIFESVCATLGRYFLENGTFMTAAHDTAERAGLHVTPVHYGSPLASRDEVKAQSGRDLFGPEFKLGLDADAQRNFLESQIFPYLQELADPGAFTWDNGMLGVQDAAAYYGMVRATRPAKILEVGSGFSSLLAAQAVARNGAGTVTCIEPHPTEFWNRHLREAQGLTLIEQPVQSLDIETFRALAAGDILFIDSSHVVKPASDLEHLIFRVLPVLAPGVVVHFHDIFLPKGYSDDFYLAQHRNWNENYILAAYLANNSDWRILLANHFLFDDTLTRRLIATLAGGDPARQAALFACAGAGSLWLCRR